MSPIAVLRPEPGNRATVARIRARGAVAIALPLFAARPLPWRVPDAAGFDALLVTSANVFRHGGPGLESLRGLPVLAVGEATAAAAAGFHVALTGRAGVAELLDDARGRGFRHVLHLAGRDRTPGYDEAVAAVSTLYAVDPLPIPAERLAALHNGVALLHSARAARRLAELLDAGRARVGVAAISAQVRAAAGEGWRGAAVAAATSDEALIDAALTLAG